ncbi:hypothetical protein A0H81_09135 [Grifola frondosa]|uniref:Uncharacterized protein n=1 Tax=Grifola frondosa TaxID=5627 RepID=A0A1C7M3B7_GRIFR|nr:hypothetical protein A0H81_09135 [Grifola frondosa]
MDNIVAIGVGLGLRAIIDLVTHHDLKLGGSLVGLWEGAVLHHFLVKYPSSFDPYVGFGFRLLVDMLFTESVKRMTIVVLWAGLGMLLTNLGVDLWTDRRFRRLTRQARHYLSTQSFDLSSSGRGPQRVQFMHISPSSTTRSPPVQTRAPLRSEVLSAPVPSRASPSHFTRSFSDQLSETDTDASRERQPPTRSELEYVTLPLPDIPDLDPDASAAGALEEHLRDHASGLTTSTNEHERPRTIIRQASPDRSGLATPVGRLSSPHHVREELPPVTIMHEDDEGNGAAMNPSGLSDTPPIPIPIRPPSDIPEAEEQANISFPIPDIPTPQPTPDLVPSAQFIPEIPIHADPETGGNIGTTAPPPYEPTPGEAPEETSHTDSDEMRESVISGRSRGAIIAKAEDMRKRADEEEKTRARLHREYEDAKRNHEYYMAFRLKVERDAADREAHALHEKAARRFWRGT